LLVPPEALTVTFVIVGEEEEKLYTPKWNVPPEPVAVTFVIVGEEE
jgi:hypothetical protein